MKENVDYFDKAIALVGNNCQSYLCKGMVHAKYGRLDEALTNFSKAIEIYPHYKQAISERAAIYRKQNLHSECE